MPPRRSTAAELMDRNFDDCSLDLERTIDAT
jgi:hypothetical protein